ncbi:MAG TPA: TonB-dependent receptor [Casimicrobiaceae bacterium]|nr:TonB-dependent receptor [Casimicrobiaceae bacterium]
MGATTPSDLAELSLEELSNITITSVSRHAEQLSKAPASIFVITAEDIRRSGATTLPEALRLAPNLAVAQTGAGDYAISARGFNNAIGNKLLVLIDGRTIYTPLFSGVNWDSQYPMLEDIDRIEVISGPGATLWGANAVNGVINIISREAQRTQGALVSAGGGNREQRAAARYGSPIGADGFARIYALADKRDHTEHEDGTSVPDGWRYAQTGFRADWAHADRTLTVQGDAYGGRKDSGPLGRPTVDGANLLARWNATLENKSTLQIQSYIDHTSRDDPLSLSDRVDIFDIEFQHGMTLGERHTLLWGGGYRYAHDSTQTHFNAINPLPQVYVPASRSLDWADVFVQDEIAVRRDFKLTLGLKAETNVYTDLEFLPTIRAAWIPDADRLVWAAISRAVRAPARIDREFQLFLSLPNRPLIPVIKGGPDFQSEIADVLEVGYRATPSTSVYYSVTAFYAFYDRLRSGQPPPAFVQNLMQGSTYGVEAWGGYQPLPAWRLSAGMTLLREDLRIKAGSLDPTGPSALGNDPRFQWMLRSQYNLTRDIDFDVGLRHVNELPNPIVPAYTALDVRLAWRPRNDLELSAIVRNATDPEHPEFGPAATRSEIAREVFLQVQWRM